MNRPSASAGSGLEVELRAEGDHLGFFVGRGEEVEFGARHVQLETDVVDRDPIHAERVAGLLATRRAGAEAGPFSSVS